jgi:hypothetical protein
MEHLDKGRDKSFFKTLDALFTGRKLYQVALSPAAYESWSLRLETTGFQMISHILSEKYLSICT